MKKVLIIYSLLFLLLTGGQQCTAMSLKFDLNFDGVIGDTEHVLTNGQLIKIGIWLDEYDPDNPDSDIFVVSYDFVFDTSLLAPWPSSETAVQLGELWDPPPFSSVSYSEDEGLYEINLGSFAGIDVPSGGKIFLNTIVLRNIGEGEGYVIAREGLVTADREYPADDALGTILGPCKITMTPESSTECTGSTIDPDTGIYTAGEPLSGNTGNDVVQAIDSCNGDISVTTEVTVTALPPATTTTTSTLPNPGPPPGPTPTTTTTIKSIGETCITDKSCNDLVFCNGEEFCNKIYSWSSDSAGSTSDTGTKVGICTAGEIPCSDDGQFCNGEESCDEENKICLHSGDPCEPEGLICDEENDICIEPCFEDSDCDDGRFCTGQETCDNGKCLEGEYPCLPGELCDEENDICIPEGVTLSFNIIPQSALRSHVLFLPLIMFIRSDDEGNVFERGSTSVTFAGGDIINPPWTMVLTERLLYVFSLVKPAGLPVTEDSTEVTVEVVTPEGMGTAIMHLILLPFI